MYFAKSAKVLLAVQTVVRTVTERSGADDNVESDKEESLMFG